MIKAIVFDFDGLILDTETPEYESFQAMYQDHGAHLPIEVWGRFIGTDGSDFEPYQFLEQCLGMPFDRETARMLRRERFAARMLGELPRPGVIDYLTRAKTLNLGIGLASSSTKAWVTGYLTQHSLIDSFHCLRTRDDVAQTKPDPELYLQVLDSLGVQPYEALAFEDSPNGALAAKRAGMYCVVVPNTITRLLEFGEFDLRLDSMEDLSLDDVFKKLAGIRG